MGQEGLAAVSDRRLRHRQSHLPIVLGTEAAMAGYVHRPRLCTAIVDRLTLGGNIIETGTDSFRLAQTRANDHLTTTDSAVS